MGCNSKGKIAYGFDLMDEYAEMCSDFLEEFDNDFDDFVIHHYSDLKPPNNNYHPSNEEYAANKKEWSEYTEAKYSWAKANPFPLELVRYCHYDGRRLFLAAKGSEQVAYGYTPERIDLPLPEFDNQIFKDFCEKHNVPYQEPAWYLLGDYS